MNKNELADHYAQLIEPILPLAKKAFGPRNYKSEFHVASREYTRLLVKFSAEGGSLLLLAKRLDVAYAGLRRRVVMSDVSVATLKPEKRIKSTEEEMIACMFRVLIAKGTGVDAYHDQLAEEYHAGISLSNLAKKLKLSSAAPLYYGVQRSIQKKAVKSEHIQINESIHISAPEVPVISVTAEFHMAIPNETPLAEAVEEIDLMF